MRHEPRIITADTHPIIIRLAETRLAWGLTINDLASRIGCSDFTLMHMECGSKMPSGKMLLRWADVLGYQLNLWPKGNAQ